VELLLELLDAVGLLGELRDELLLEDDADGRLGEDDELLDEDDDDGIGIDAELDD
jgi:hypothetical protein